MTAEWSVVTGMAVVGGAMPSERLRRQAGFVGSVLQLISLAYVLFVAFFYFLGVTGDLVGGPGPAAGPAPRGGRPAGGGGGGGAGKTLIMMLLIGVLGVSAAYTYLHYSLFAAGQSAAGGDKTARRRGHRER